MKNRITVTTTSVIKNINNTIQKLQVDKETFNNDIKEIERTIYDDTDNISLYSAQI